MDIEIRLLRQNFDNIEFQTISNHEFAISVFRDMKIVTVVSGVGKVNAAITTQILIDTFHPDYMINTGIAGGLDKSLNHHDIILGTEFLYHDFNRQILKDYYPFVDKFVSDSHLLHFARKVLSESGVPFREGMIISGDQFISSTEKSEQLFQEYGALCVEMESTAIAHCCFTNDVPVVILRSLSDFADDDAESDYDANDQMASDRVGKIIYNLICEIQ